MSDKLTPFEEQLAQLVPHSSVDPDQVLFEAGRATAARELQLQPSPYWRWCAIASSLAAVVALLAFGATLSALQQTRHDVASLQQTLAENQRPPTAKPIEAEPSSAEKSKAKVPRVRTIVPDAHVARVRKNPNSQFRMRNQALQTGLLAAQHNRSRRGGLSPISFGDSRRVLAMLGETPDSVRHLETLRPR